MKRLYIALKLYKTREALVQNENDFNHFLRAFEFLDYLRSERGRRKKRKKRDIKLEREVIEPCRPSNRVDGSANILLCHPPLPFSLSCITQSISFPRLWLYGCIEVSTLYIYIYIHWTQSVNRGQPLHMLSISRSNTTETTSTRSLRNPPQRYIYWLAVHTETRISRVMHSLKMFNNIQKVHIFYSSNPIRNNLITKSVKITFEKN